MRFVFYTHSLISDWNHGNAHFLRGVLRDLQRRGHETSVFEPENSWSRANLMQDRGQVALDQFHATFPSLKSQTYGPTFDHEEALSSADVVVVHEWTDPALITRIGKARRNGGTFTLIFHDTHHRAVSAEGEISGLELGDYDLVLAFGETLRERYLAAGWGRKVFTWHEAADDVLFRPLPEFNRSSDLIWIGNWGDGERSAELEEFLIEPTRSLGLKATIRGVRYPDHALESLKAAGAVYGGWIANSSVPEAFAEHRLTVHVPRRPYVENLPGIPTIRVFEALACGIPLISAPWNDVEGLFRVGKDFTMVTNGTEMKSVIRELINEPDRAEALSRSGLETIRTRHTCRHRVNELLAILTDHGTQQVRDNLKQKEAAE